MSSPAINPDPYAAYGGSVAPASPSPAADPYAAYGGRIAPGATSGLTAKPTPPPRPQPAQDAIASDLFSNPKGEGLYQMKSPAGTVAAIPFSKVRTAIPAGYALASPEETARYAKDFHEAPVASWKDLLGDIEERPSWRHWLDPTTVLPEETAGGMKGVATTAEGFRKLLGMEPKKPDILSEVANRPNANAQESLGELRENAGEFVSGEELLGLIGKAVKGGEALNDAGKVAQLLDKYPQVARVLKVGMNALKNIPELGQAVLGAGQTFIKTGGDKQAAIESGVATGAAGGLMRLGGAVGSAAKALFAGAPEAAAGPGAAEYAQVARNAAQPHLEAINESRALPEQPVLMNQPSHDAPVLMNQPGGAPAVPVAGPRITTPAVPTGAVAKPTEIPQVNIPETLGRMHDFTGTADRLTEVNNAGYNELDQATGGKFRDLNAQAMAARKAVWKGVDGAGDQYRAAMSKMDALIDGSPRVTPQQKEALKASWRASYLLHDFGDLWDRNLDGVPGASQASQTQRGINGKGLIRDLARAVKIHGRGTVEETLGNGGLETLEEIGNANLTQAGRRSFNQAVWTVVKHLHYGATLGGVTGAIAGGEWKTGAAVGAGTAGAADVFNALKANPKIAQNFLFAVRSGATPERYGPMIGTMISHYLTEDSRERQQQQEQTK